MRLASQLTYFALALGISAQGLPEPPTVIKKSPPSLVGRDLATVTSVVATVDTNIKGLNSAVQAFTGDASGINSASQALINSIKQGTASIAASGELSLQDALGLQSVVTGLQTDGDALVASLQAKKTAIEQAGLCSNIFQTATQLGTDSKGLIDAVVSKVPQAAQTVAQQLASGVTTTLQSAADSFSPGKCNNAAGAGGGAASGSASASASAPAGASSGLGVSKSATGSTRAITASQTAAIPSSCMCPCACQSTRLPTLTPPVQQTTPTSRGVPTSAVSSSTRRGNQTTTGPATVVTAAAPSLGLGVPAGLFAAALAAALL